MPQKITSHRDLQVYQCAYRQAMAIYELSKSFNADERFSLTDQIRRSSRSVCANLGEAWRKRRYEAAFKSKLSDSEAEAGETQVWLEFAASTENMDKGKARELHQAYDEVISMLVSMINNPDPWLLKGER